MYPTSLLPILFSLFLLHQRTHAECEPVTCGELPIKYPFWLGGPSYPSNSSCGHPAFELRCTGNSTSTTWALASGIHVHDIDYDTSSFLVSHDRVTHGTDAVCCTDFNMSTILTLAPFEISPTNLALCFLYGCNGTEPRGPDYVNAIGVPSCNWPISVYLGGSYYRNMPPAIPTGNCIGFVLDWIGTRAGDCSACSASGGQCRYNNGSTAFACLCSVGNLHESTCAEGGYGVVFKGRLHDGRLVAAKFLHDCKENGDEFVNEVMSIGRTSHINVVSLFGSLDKYIYSENPKEILGWERLYGIAIGIARGLEYLHHSCNTRIIHFDIKPQNILLDSDFNPKIADFGLPKLCHTKERKLSMMGARGTIGFIAPEVYSRTFGVVSTKSDVYSYGMMLIEMVGGRRNVKSIVTKSSEKYFPDWIYDNFEQEDGLQACEVTSGIEEIAKKMTLIGLWCIQVLPMHRPTITNVLEMFDRSLDDLDMPPKQNLCELL
ncbi:hypothetical protein VPH35_049397 [Triticum aestivum]